MITHGIFVCALLLHGYKCQVTPATVAAITTSSMASTTTSTPSTTVTEPTTTTLPTIRTSLRDCAPPRTCTADASFSPSACVLNLCQNGGQCINRGASGVCVCAIGFTGLLCQTQTWTPCALNSCLGGGSCFRVPTGSSACTCPYPQSGKFCQHYPTTTTTTPSIAVTAKANVTTTFVPPAVVYVDNACQSSPCRNGICKLYTTTASPQQLLYKCICGPCCDGKDCGSCHDPCLTHKCQSGGVCMLDGRCRPYCDCQNTGYIGEACAYKRSCNPCDQQPCKNNGTCVSSGQYFNCHCTSDWTGRLCELERNPCSTQTHTGQMVCSKGMKCIVDHLNRATCTQPTKNPQCFAKGETVCQNGGTCTMVIRPTNELVPRCLCKPGFTGRKCQVGANPCLPAPMCLYGGRCEANGPQSFHCRCPAHLSGDLCQRCDPCSPNPCENDGVCTPIVNATTFDYKCACKKPYRGRLCTRTQDPCSNWLCFHGGTCRTSDRDEPQCHCPQDFVGDRCQYEDLCRRHFCQKPGTERCETNPVNGEMQCRCTTGSTGYQGPNCQYTNSAVMAPNFCNINSPCENGGICKVVNGRYSCICKDQRYWGQSCERSNCTIHNRCATGRCVLDAIGNANCECDTDEHSVHAVFEGDWCHTFIGLRRCRQRLCSKNGDCAWSGTYVKPQDLHCQCYAGFTGQYCASNISNKTTTTVVSTTVSPSTTTTTTLTTSTTTTTTDTTPAETAVTNEPATSILIIVLLVLLLLLVLLILLVLLLMWWCRKRRRKVHDTNVENLTTDVKHQGADKSDPDMVVVHTPSKPETDLLKGKGSTGASSKAISPAEAKPSTDLLPPTKFSISGQPNKTGEDVTSASSTKSTPKTKSPAPGTAEAPMDKTQVEQSLPDLSKQTTQSTTAESKPPSSASSVAPATEQPHEQHNVAVPSRCAVKAALLQLMKSTDHRPTHEEQTSKKLPPTITLFVDKEKGTDWSKFKPKEKRQPKEKRHRRSEPYKAKTVHLPAEPQAPNKQPQPKPEVTAIVVEEYD